MFYLSVYHNVVTVICKYRVDFKVFTLFYFDPFLGATIVVIIIIIIIIGFY